MAIATSASGISAPAIPPSEIASRTLKKITWRLIPFLGFIYLIAYIDRQNVSYAKLQMVDDLGLSEYAYGLGASLFFIGYFLFEVPSNIFLQRVGARVWFTRIMVSWGIVTIALAFTKTQVIFYILRFLLGACEAGFFPGVLFVLTLWFPFSRRAKMVGSFMLFSALANAVGAPIGGMLLDLDGAFGLRGWEWVFIVTGIPAVVMGFVTFFYLDDRPEDCRFLTAEGKAWLHDTLAAEDRSMGKTDHGNPLAALLDGRVQLMCLYYIAFPLAAYGLSYWLPTIVKGFGVSNTVNGWINVIPWLIVAAALWIVPSMASASGKQTPYIVVPALFGAACLLLSVYVPGNVAKFAFLCGASGGHLRGATGALESAIEFSDRRFCRSRACRDQLGRQSRRLHRAEHRAVDQGSDRQQHRTDVVPGHLSHHRRSHDIPSSEPDPSQASQHGHRGAGNNLIFS